MPAARPLSLDSGKSEAEPFAQVLPAKARAAWPGREEGRRVLVCVYDFWKNQLDLLFSGWPWRLAIVGLVAGASPPPPRRGLAMRLPMLKPPVGEPRPRVLPALAASKRSLTAAS